MKKETLEKAAENYGWRIKRNTFSDAVKANELAESAQQDFIAGAKYQAERMYSEEEVLNFTQIILSQYIVGNTNIEQLDLLKETLHIFKKK